MLFAAGKELLAAGTIGDGKGLEAGVGAELFEDVLDVVAHGGGTDAELVGNVSGPPA
jgi:hypothetical protein